MSYLQYGCDILKDVLFRAGELSAVSGTSVSDYLGQTKVFVQRAYNEVLEYAPWPWALKDPPGVLSLTEKATGSAVFTHASTAVTLCASDDTSRTGYWIWLDDEEIPYRIASHAAGYTSVTIDAEYTSATASAGAYSIFKDEYEVASDCLRVWRAWLRDDPNHVIDVITEGEMSSLYPGRNVGTYPRKVALIRGTKLRISPWPDTTPLTLEYEYTRKPSSDLTFDNNATTDVPIVPLLDRPLIADIALGLLYHTKNDPRAAEIMGLVQGKFAAMLNIYLPVGKTRLYIRPGQGIWRT